MRSTFRIVVIVSTLACAGLIVLFIRSIYVADLIRYRTARGTYIEIATIPSQIRISHAVSWPTEQPLAWMHGSYQTLSSVGAIGHHMMSWQVGAAVDSQSWRVGAATGVSRVNASTMALSFPIPIGTTAIPLILAWIGVRIDRRRKKNRQDQGLCHICGYDLRAATGRCPECGEATQTVG